MSSATQLAINWVEQGLVPDQVIRAGIRRLVKERLAEIRAGRRRSGGRDRRDVRARAAPGADRARSGQGERTAL